MEKKTGKYVFGQDKTPAKPELSPEGKEIQKLLSEIEGLRGTISNVEGFGEGTSDGYGPGDYERIQGWRTNITSKEERIRELRKLISQKKA